MEVLFMDKTYSTTKIVDSFTSCIWRDRYIGYGDFELYFPMDHSALIGIEIGYYASIRESKRYMVVEGINISTSVEEGTMLTITGRSLESILEYRIIREDVILKGKFQECIMRLLNSNAISPENVNRILPGLVFKEADNQIINEIELDFELKAGDNLYDAIYVLCDAYRIGFQINPLENGTMEFSLYTGIDRSYDQEIYPWVVFSPKFENLKESNMLTDVTNQKTVVICDQKYMLQHADETETEEILTVLVNDEKTGFDRKEIYLSGNVSIEKVDKEQFGKPEDRVNIRDYMTWEPIFFNRPAYEDKVEKWNDKISNAKPNIKEERTEWVQALQTPEWQANHPGENPFVWVQEKIPGTSAVDAAKQQAYYNNLLSKEPKKEDYTVYGWVLSDPRGYRDALDRAQEEIDEEFEEAVADKVKSATDTLTTQCKTELEPYLIITNYTGEIESNLQNIFGRDYYLGDIVSFVNEFNFQATTRVMSMTYSQDTQNGYMACPTFQSDNEAVFKV